MATCSRCGAENKPTATMCRMCATPLNIAADSSGNPGSSKDPKAGASGEILCATCGAVNGSSWSFCQQCGSPLNKTAAANPIISQNPVIPSPPPAPTPPLPPPVAYAAPPTVISSPMAAPRTVMSKPVSPSSVPSPNINNPALAQSGTNDGIMCVSCGKSNLSGSSFCAACGSPFSVEKTLVMKAQPRATLPARLRLIQETGGEGEIYKLENDEISIGRNAGDIRFPHDGYMSGKHARIVREGDQYILIDENSRNGTFKKIDGQVTLKSGDVLLIGKQLFRFEM